MRNVRVRDVMLVIYLAFIYLPSQLHKLVTVLTMCMGSKQTNYSEKEIFFWYLDQSGKSPRHLHQVRGNTKKLREGK